MKVIQICVQANMGSVGRIAEQIGNKVIDEGGVSYIAYARGANISNSQLIKIGNSYDIYLHGICTRLFDSHGFSSKSATSKLIDEIKHINPDIIHMHGLHGYYINIDRLFSFLKQYGKPVFWTFHDCWAFTGHCSYFEYVKCNKWETECNQCPQLGEYPNTWFLDRTKSNFYLKREIFNNVSNLTIIPVSFWLNNLVKKSFLSNYPTEVIHNGIDINVFKPSQDFSIVKSKYKIMDKFTVLGVASTWEKRKGLTYFIKLRKILNIDFQIVLVGLTNKQKNELPPGIIGLERTESVDELSKLYNLADVFVNPTLEDTYPTTNLESISCGTPVITFNTGGSPESITIKTGFVIDKGNIDELVEKINYIRLVGKASFQDNCREFAISHFDKNINFNKYIKLYKARLSNNNL